MTNKIYFLTLFCIACLSLFLRLHELENRPVHHDESINGWFIEKIINEGEYQYQPRHYHGPTFFWLGFFSSKILGLNLFSIRLVAAVFGFLLCLSPLIVKKEVGKIGALTAVLAFSIAPAYLYYSRYAIHEILLACFFTFGALSLYRFIFSGKRYFFLTGGLLLGFSAATKETVIIYSVGILFGLIMAVFFGRDQSERPVELIKKRLLSLDIIMFLVIVLAGLLTWFSLKGLWAFFQSYLFYFNLGTGATGHEKSWYYFFKLLLEYESFLIMGGAGGIALAVYKRKSFDLFCLGWFMVVFFVHSIIAYKTPWIIINLTLPLTFLTGSFVNELLKKMKEPYYRFALIALLVLLAGKNSYRSILYSFKYFNEPKNPYAYVQTFTDAHNLSAKILEILKKNKDIKVAFVSPMEWPYPFLLRGYDQVVYWRRIPKGLDAEIVVARDNQYDELPPGFKENYQREKYKIRRGLNLELLISKKLLE